jgi:hypothetical protein
MWHFTYPVSRTIQNQYFYIKRSYGVWRGFPANRPPNKQSCHRRVFAREHFSAPVPAATVAPRDAIGTKLIVITQFVCKHGRQRERSGTVPRIRVFLNRCPCIDCHRQLGVRCYPCFHGGNGRIRQAHPRILTHLL